MNIDSITLCYCWQPAHLRCEFRPIVNTTMAGVERVGQVIGKDDYVTN